MNIFSRSFFWITTFFIAGSFAYSTFLNIPFIRLNTVLIFFLVPSLIVLGNLCFQAIKLGTNSFSKRKFTTKKKLPNLKNALYASTFLSVVYFFLFLNLNINSFNILTIPSQIAIARYTDALLMPGYLKILRLFVTLASILGVFEYMRKKEKIALFAIFLIVFDGLMSSGKAGPLQGLLLCVATLLCVSRIYLNKKLKISNRLKINLGVGLVSFLFLSQLSRLNKFDTEVSLYVLKRLFGYAFAGINAFDIWFNELYLASDEKLLGALTFSGIFDNLGIRERVSGVFTEGIVFADQPPTNIYTGLRFLIMDFGIGGSILFIFLLSFLLSLIVDKIRISSYELIPFSSLIITYFIWNFFASVLAYNTYIFTAIILYMFLLWKRRIKY